MVILKLEDRMKVVKRVLLGFLILIGGLILFLAGSIVVDGMAGGGRVDDVTNTKISGLNDGPDVRAYVARPEGDGPFPTVIMIHEFFGLNDSIVSKADLLAEQGYLVVAPDTFRGSSTAWIPRAIYQVITTQPEDVDADLDSVYTWLEMQQDVDSRKIAITGFCYGGRTSLLYSLHNKDLAATVVFYGSLETDPAVLENLPGPVLGIFGGADQSISLEDVEAFEKGLEAAGIPHQITIYEGQPHAFVQDADGIKASGAQGEAWNEMLIFLEENLKNKTGQNRSLVPFDYHAPFAWRYYAMLVYEHAFGTASHIH
jgi:carboxymethylenebutenolidase